MFFGALVVLGAVLVVVDGITADRSVPHVIANGVGIPAGAAAMFIGYRIYRASDQQK